MAWLKVSRKSSKNCEICGEAFQFKNVYKSRHTSSNNASVEEELTLTPNPPSLSILEFCSGLLPKIKEGIKEASSMFVFVLVWFTCLPMMTTIWVSICSCITSGTTVDVLEIATAMVGSGVGHLVSQWWNGVLTTAFSCCLAFGVFHFGSQFRKEFIQMQQQAAAQRAIKAAEARVKVELDRLTAAIEASKVLSQGLQQRLDEMEAEDAASTAAAAAVDMANTLPEDAFKGIEGEGEASEGGLPLPLRELDESLGLHGLHGEEEGRDEEEEEKGDEGEEAQTWRHAGGDIAVLGLDESRPQPPPHLAAAAAAVGGGIAGSSGPPPRPHTPLPQNPAALFLEAPPVPAPVPYGLPPPLPPFNLPNAPIVPAPPAPPLPPLILDPAPPVHAVAAQLDENNDININININNITIFQHLQKFSFVLSFNYFVIFLVQVVPVFAGRLFFSVVGFPADFEMDAKELITQVDRLCIFIKRKDRSV